jgi:hypothetical protein
LFLPIVHQLVGYQVGLTAGGRVRSRLVNHEEELEQVDAEKPVKATKVIAAAVVETPAIIQHERFAEVVNTSPRESETEPSTRKDFEDRFGFEFVESDGSAANSDVIKEDVEFRPDELWHWIACVVLGVVLLEGFVGNRTTA